MRKEIETAEVKLLSGYDFYMRGDVVTLPTTITKILVKRGIAVLTENGQPLKKVNEVEKVEEKDSEEKEPEVEEPKEPEESEVEETKEDRFKKRLGRRKR